MIIKRYTCSVTAIRSFQVVEGNTDLFFADGCRMKFKLPVKRTQSFQKKPKFKVEVLQRQQFKMEVTADITTVINKVIQSISRGSTLEQCHTDCGESLSVDYQ